ncbi:MAG: DNA translocase FtsK 4TM domain-containing protein [bacterium]|nr:DNA translocase FtsK 4TM domain-containing protein [bacterium]
MARKKNKKENSSRWHDGLKPETKQSIFAIVSFALALLFTLAAFGEAGLVGGKVQKLFELLFGKAFFLVPLVFFLAGLSFLFSLRKHFVLATLIGAVLFLLASLGLADLVFGDIGPSTGPSAGGWLGFLASFPFLKLFDFWAALVLLLALALVGILIMLNVPLRRPSSASTLSLRATENKEEKIALSAASPQINLPLAVPPATAKLEEKDEFITSPLRKMRRAATSGGLMPPLDILEDDRGTPSSGDIKANANIIKRTLQNFGIEVEMTEVNVGPSVTQYTLKPAEGVKLAKITALANDLALALAAHPLRIEAPIPGRSLVGIEIPNRSIALVGLRSLISADDFQKAQNPLLFALGRDVSGRAAYADIARMPHLLIAGATGTGKSVAIHSILTSLLYRNPPELLRFIIIDPKRVELASYSQIPHLLTPVITDAKKTILALKWAGKEMERRYEVLAKNSVRDVHSYHANVFAKDSEAESMPYLVIVIDELADIMATYPRELEASIIRLAQMSRAVGIHLILSTQRPSVEVITGLIKANITSRIAFQVASQVDSRTILDASGAEKLLGNGDMLFLAGDVSKPRRIQGAFVSEKEVKKVTSWLSEHAEESERADAPADIFEAKAGSPPAGGAGIFDDSSLSDEDDDELYVEARRLAIEAGKVSASYLQRRLKVGYARAARLLDLMEERGVIGPGDGAKPREILLKEEKKDSEKEGFYESFS